jgi:hypothetical protein
MNLVVLVLALRVAVKAGTHQKKSVADRARYRDLLLYTFIYFS